ncbi:MAG: T9SS type A sorting domain-containing protein [Bacteroidales bacterium]|jgi:hypothetical protein|nr:T9SS type A sorting domain-containing protein [Bacteroidales bacterium]
MKNTISTIILLFLLVFSSLSLFAQWEGAGTEDNPYKIYSVEDLNFISTNEANFNSYSDIHFELMTNIDDTLYTKLGEEFYGYFHGKGHYITLGFNDSINLVNEYKNVLFKDLYGTIDSLTVEGKVDCFTHLFYHIKPSGKLLNVISNLVIEPVINENPNSLVKIGVFAGGNEGVMENCINNSNLICDYNRTTLVGIFTPCGTNSGHIINCINNGNIKIYATPQYLVFCFIFCQINLGTIDNCINYGNIEIIGVPSSSIISGFALRNRGYIQNCINTGNVDARKSDAAGVFAAFNSNIVRNCLNTGTIIGRYVSGSIVGVCEANSIDTLQVVVENCLNTNYAYGETRVGGIVGELRQYNDTIPIIVRNNISLSKTDKYSIFGDSLSQSAYYPIEILENNFYDKQMVTQTASASGDVEGKAEGLLTTEMTGFTLQSVLGDGWSYAEGRYPIPLGLENDSISLLVATPIYLKFTDQQNYNTVDSVSANFTVGLENNVVWNETYGRVSFDDEYATLLSLGYENLVVSLGDYKKEVYINILDTETSIRQESISENGVLYPNPASDYVNIKIDGISADKLKICDISGKLILSQTITNDYQQIQIRDLKRGMYFLKIYDKNQNIKTLKFIKH